MVTPRRATERAPDASDVGLPAGDGVLIDGGTFEATYGEPLERTLDLDTWNTGEDLGALYSRLEAEVRAATAQTRRARDQVRALVFPRLSHRPGAPDGAGVYQARVEDIARVHRGLLFNSQVEACDGTSLVHDTLPLTITQIGICLVSYQGSTASWVQRLFRRDLRVKGMDPVAEALALLERRMQRGAVDLDDPHDTLAELGRRGIMAYGERAVLLRKSTARWRMGHGAALPYEILTGSGSMELLAEGLKVLRSLLLEHRRVVFVPSRTADRFLLMLGEALLPLEFAIVETAQYRASRIVERGHYEPTYRRLARDFVDEAGPQVVVGVYRASAHAPPYVFHAHQDHAHEAALIALADAALQEHRGFPMLIDLADKVCQSTFGSDPFAASVELAYTDAGEPYRYLAERQTRYGT